MKLSKNLLLSDDMPFAIEKRTFLKKNTMNESHYHSHYELLYVLENERRLIVNNREYSLNSGTVALIAPYTPHRTVAGDRSPETRILVNFTESLVHPILDGMGVDFLSIFNPASPVLELSGNSDALKDMLLRLLDVSEREDTPHREARCALILSDALFLLYGISGEGGHTRTFFDVTKYIERHFAERITLDSLAKRFFMSKYTFLRKFKAHTGMGLPAYVNTIRLINAKAMLSSGAKVAEAAMACGFESLSNFDRVFRRETGMSPREYVNLAISNKA